jgi:hypothetical protein
MPETIVGSINDALSVRLYGNVVTDLSITGGGLVTTLDPTKTPIFARIYGAKAFGACITLPKPMITIVPSNGAYTQADDCEQFYDPANPNAFTVWVLQKGSPLITLTTKFDTVDSLAVTPKLDVNADFHVYNLSVSGSVVSGTLRAYLHLHQPGPFGTTIFDVTVIDGNYPFQISLTPDICIPVPGLSAGVISAEVCYHPNPNRICGSVNVNVSIDGFGYNHTFDIVCVNF